MMKKVKKIMLIAILSIIGIIVLFFAVIFAFRFINAQQNKIKTPNGIQENTYVEIGGIKQYVQIRGKNADNPVVLWLHGGPGFPLTYLSYYYQTELENDYTFVCWEQRGCGRTYYKNGESSETTVDVLLTDMDGLVDYLKKRFGQDKIIIIGQSWGTILGTEYINMHPEKVSAYIGIGQVTDFWQGKIYAAERAAEIAKQSGNLTDESLLLSCIDEFNKSKSTESLDLKNLTNMIITSSKYLKADGELSGLKQMWLGITSPEMSLNDIRWFLTASNSQTIMASQKALIDHIYTEFNVESLTNEYSLPVCFIQGSNDYITPTGMVSDYYSSLKCENKKFVIIENAGHTPFLDNPKEYCNAVKNFLDNALS